VQHPGRPHCLLWIFTCGQPGLVAQLDGVTVAVYAFDITGDRIKHIWAVLNPDKLRPWRGV